MSRNHKKSNSHFVLFLLLCVMFAFAGCTKDPFSTRNSEDPRTVGGTYLDPVSAEIALDNLFHAVNERNIANYSRTLADTFTYEFDFLNTGQPGDQTAWPHAEELRVAENAFRDLARIALAWTPSQTDLESDSSAVMYRAYAITTITTGNDADTSFYAGEAIL